uniref:Uncharacterized protein n=1 Tax=Meloidogyne incognita TaxID=6306 RepID=A0A914MNF7_MELIC
MSKISQKDIAHIQPDRSQQAETTDSTMECDPTPTIGSATTESSAPPTTTETAPTHPRVRPPSLASIKPPSLASIKLPSLASFKLPSLASFKLPSLASLKLPQRYNIASRVRILESGTIEAPPIQEHSIKKNVIRKWKRTRNKRIHKRITISKPTPLNKVHINPTYIHNLLTPPPPPNFMPNLKNTPAPSIRSLCSPSIVSAPVPIYMPNPQISFVAVPILTPATPLVFNAQPFCGPGVSRLNANYKFI